MTDANEYITCVYERHRATDQLYYPTIDVRAHMIKNVNNALQI